MCPRLHGIMTHPFNSNFGYEVSLLKFRKKKGAVKALFPKPAGHSSCTQRIRLCSEQLPWSVISVTSFASSFSRLIVAHLRTLVGFLEFPTSQLSYFEVLCSSRCWIYSLFLFLIEIAAQVDVFRGEKSSSKILYFIREVHFGCHDLARSISPNLV